MNKPLHLLVDANPLVGKKSGIGHFTYRLIEGLVAESDNVEITAYYFNFLGRKPTPELPGNGKVTYKVIRWLPTKFLNILHRFHLQAPMEFFLGFKRFDFMIFPNFVAVPSLRKTPFMAVVHDLGFIDCPQYVTAGNRLYLQRFVKRSVTKAAFVGAISEFTKQRLVDTYDISSNKVVVLPIPYEPGSPSGEVSEKIKQIAKKPFILYVGTIEPRKNIDGLVSAFALTDAQIRQDYQLVLAGGWGWKTEQIKSTIEKNEDRINVVLPGYVSDAEKEFLYQKAALVCIPSHYEGFGMQLLEALYYQKKLLLSDIPVFHEVAGSSAYFTDISNLTIFYKDIENILKETKPLNVTMPSWSWSTNSRTIISRVRKQI